MTAADFVACVFQVELGVFVIGLVFYFVMKQIRKAQGVDVTLAFKEIPIE